MSSLDWQSQARGIPEDATLEEVKAVFEDAGIPVASVVFDDAEQRSSSKLRLALVRLPAPTFPWTITAEELASHPLDVALALYTTKRQAAADEAAVEAAAAAAVAAEAAAVVAAEVAAATAADVAAKAPADEAAPAATEAEAMGSSKPAEDASAAAAAPAEVTDTEVKPVAAVAEIKPETAVAVSAVSAVTAAKAAAPPAVLEDGRKEGDVATIARYYATRISELKFPLTLRGSKIVCDAIRLPCTLFVGNVASDDNELFRTEMGQWGTLERCFIVYNAAGVSKVGWLCRSYVHTAIHLASVCGAYHPPPPRS